MTVSEAITALTAIAALVFTGLSLNATRDQVATLQQQNKVTEQGQNTDRYIRAVQLLDQAGPDHLQGRLGAIYALARLAHDSPRDQPTIIEILSAFIRSGRPAPTRGSMQPCPPQPLAPDARAALTVLGRRDHTHDNNTRTDLSNTCLNGADLSYMDLRGADLSRTDLFEAQLRSANLNGANLNGAMVAQANLLSVDLRDADLGSTNLSTADLSYALLRGADLRSADLHGANLRFAELYDADLFGADLRSADLRGVRRDSQTDVRAARTDSSTVGKWW